MIKKFNNDGSISKKYLKFLDGKENWFRYVKSDFEKKKSSERAKEINKIIEKENEKIADKIKNRRQSIYNIYQNEDEDIEEIIKIYNKKQDIKKVPLYYDEIQGSLKYKHASERMDSKYDRVKCASVHVGQRKLLLTEVLFLSTYGLQNLPTLKRHELNGNLPKNKKVPIIIYAGAGPGSHLLMLCELFKGVVFHNFDMTYFDKNLKRANFPNNFLYQKLFLEDDVKKYGKLADEGYQIYLMSDIRTVYDNYVDGDKVGIKVDKKYEERVNVDNKLMEKFVLGIKPISTLLKFRLPYEVSKYNYLDGDIMLQPWAGVNSGETRLIIENLKNNRNRKYKYKNYDGKDYEDKFYYHNNVTKEYGFFEHGLPCSGYYPYDKKVDNSIERAGIGLDNCYNCGFEILTWCSYLGLDLTRSNQEIKIFMKENSHKIIKLFNENTGILCRLLRVNCHGLLPNKTSLEKFEFFTDENEKNNFRHRMKHYKSSNNLDVRCKYQYVKKEDLYFQRKSKK